jgi:hypothetical protein
MKLALVPTMALAAALGLAGQALAWGSSGHRMIGRAAIETLPAEVPPFLRTPAAAAALGELAREPDRSREAGRTHDADRDPGHFVDVGDDGKIGGVVPLTALPPTREDYETALRGTGVTSWRMGYLPYSIIEDWQQLTKDFAYWRADDAAARHTTNPDHRAWFETDRALREQLIFADLAPLSHFVGDGSMPLHVSIHYNGWGAFPNPNGYTQEKVHVPWEGVYVRNNVTYQGVLAAMTAPAPCECPIDQRVGAYLTADLATVVPFYELEKAGAFNGHDPKGVAFTTARVAAGAAELRDEIVMAWRASEQGKVGYPDVAVSDIEAGTVDPYDNLVGLD